MAKKHTGGRPKGSTKGRGERRVKSFRADPELIADFDRFCLERGLLHERVLEACMWWVMSLPPDSRDKILRDFLAWADSKPRPKAGTEGQKPRRRAAPS